MARQPTTLGAFSVSLAVKEPAASRAFYEKLGFKPAGGDGKNWLVLRNGTATIGLFQGLFDRNLLTFNPGWDELAQAVGVHGRARTPAPAQGKGAHLTDRSR